MRPAGWSPPRLATLLLRWSLGRSVVGDVVLGDFWEEYQRLMRRSYWSAVGWYWRETLSVCLHTQGRRLLDRVAGPRGASLGRTSRRTTDMFFSRWVSFQDVRLAVRGLLRSPGFTSIALLSLMAGIGAPTLIFSFVNMLWLQPPSGFDRPDRLAAIYTGRQPDRIYSVSSYPDFVDFESRARSFDGIAAYVAGTTMRLSQDGSVSDHLGMKISANYFRVFGIRPVLGRAFVPDEVGPNARAGVAILGYATWRTTFGGSPDVLGRDVRINGRLHTIVGVAPQGVTAPTLPVQPAFYVPLDSDSLRHRGHRGLSLMGRLAAGSTIEEAQREMKSIGEGLAERYPGSWTVPPDRKLTVTVIPESESRVPPENRDSIGALLVVLMGVVIMVLAIACFNLANLVLARNAKRTGELAVRQALGAGRSRLLGLLLSESVLLALLGGVLGIAITSGVVWAVRSRLILTELPVALALGVDANVMLFGSAMAVLTLVLIGLLPAWRAAKAELTGMLKGAGAGTFRSRRFGLRELLVTAQVGVSLIMIVTASLFIRSLQSAAELDMGFDPSQTAYLEVDLSEMGYSEGQISERRRALLKRLEALPGITQVSEAAALPMSGNHRATQVRIEGRASESPEVVSINTVGPGYFGLLRMPLLRGRSFQSGDHAQAPPVAVVNQAFVRRYWGGEGGVGKRIERGGRSLLVVGVVRDAMYRTLGEAPLARVWDCSLQAPRPAFTLLARSHEQIAPLLPELRAVIREEAADLPISDPQPLTRMSQAALLPQRIASRLLTLAGGFALFLALVGIYGVMSYAVGRRVREMGVRMALGADRSALVAMVFREGIALSAGGLVLGILGVALVSQLLSSLLIGVHPLDPISIGLGAALLCAVTLLASLVPALRAAGVDPIKALKYE